MSMGGYVAPKEGIAGGEMRGADVLPPGTVAGTSPPQESRLACEFDPAGGGRVRLSLAGQQVAQCLVCRQGVSGWLRVYTG
jgi:hypothetical protein